MKVTMFKNICAMLALLTGFVLFAQNPLATSIDSTKIKVGAQANFTIKATVKSKDRVNFPEGKLFGQLEVLESYPIDTVKKGSTYELIKKYGLTQFDSGRYVIPRLPVVINNKTLQSDSLSLEVSNVKVDTLKQKMFDIKPVASQPSSNGWVWWVLGSLVVAGALAYGIWWYVTKRKKQPAKKKADERVVSPIEKATELLQNLERKELIKQGAVKEYYSELADIARMYIEEAIHIPAMESTTTELIEAMHNATQKRKMLLKQETFEQLEQVLRTADMVKFAKSKPLEFEIAQDRSRIETTIVVIDRSIPVNQPEEDTTQAWLEAKRKLEEAKRKRRKRNLIIAAASVAMFLVAFYFSFTAVRAMLYGETTKEMLEGQWVKSEYGVPGITIETPHVLKRLDAAAIMPKDSYALFKDMAMFGDGKPFGNLYIAVATLNLKEPKELDLGTAIDGIIKNWEASGAKDILVKDEEYRTPDGVNGKRAYGTMGYPDPITKQSIPVHYDVYAFGQEQGLQQVILLYKEGDEYAPKIIERVKNSIEMKNLNPQQQQ